MYMHKSYVTKQYVSVSMYRIFTTAILAIDWNNHIFEIEQRSETLVTLHNRIK